MAYRPSRHARPDRVTNPDADAVETTIHYATAPFDRACRDADARWGTDQLVALVPVEMAAKYGKAVAALNDAIRARDVDAVKANAENCARGLAALDAWAENNNKPKADPTAYEFSRNGSNYAVIRSDICWQSLKLARPDLIIFTWAEVIRALEATGLTGESVAAVKKSFPDAKVTKVEKPKASAFNWDVGDSIPFGGDE